MKLSTVLFLVITISIRWSDLSYAVWDWDRIVRMEGESTPQVVIKLDGIHEGITDEDINDFLEVVGKKLLYFRQNKDQGEENMYCFLTLSDGALVAQGFYLPGFSPEVMGWSHSDLIFELFKKADNMLCFDCVFEHIAELECIRPEEGRLKSTGTPCFCNLQPPFESEELLSETSLISLINFILMPDRINHQATGFLINIGNPILAKRFNEFYWLRYLSIACGGEVKGIVDLASSYSLMKRGIIFRGIENGRNIQFQYQEKLPFLDMDGPRNYGTKLAYDFYFMEKKASLMMYKGVEENLVLYMNETKKESKSSLLSLSYYTQYGTAVNQQVPQVYSTFLGSGLSRTMDEIKPVLKTMDCLSEPIDDGVVVDYGVRLSIPLDSKLGRLKSTEQQKPGIRVYGVFDISQEREGIRVNYMGGLNKSHQLQLPDFDIAMEKEQGDQFFIKIAQATQKYSLGDYYTARLLNGGMLPEEKYQIKNQGGAVIALPNRECHCQIWVPFDNLETEF